MAIKKILLVDDEEDLRDILPDLLRKYGYEVETAENGLECQSKVVKFKPDLIIMDILMPQMDGYQAIMKLRETNKTVKVIVLTAFDTFKIPKEFAHVNVSAFLQKPIQASKLIATIKNLPDSENPNK